VFHWLVEQFLRGGGPPSKPRALACLVSRDSELAYLLRSLMKSLLLLPQWRGGQCWDWYEEDDNNDDNKCKRGEGGTRWLME